MTGRGFSLDSFKKKEDDAASNAPSNASTTPFLINNGRGRGISFPPKVMPSSVTSVAPSTTLGLGRGVTMGRGMFAVKPAPKTASQSAPSSDSKESSDPIKSGGKSTPQKDTSASSGIIAGRGFTTSGRGTGSSGRGRGSLSLSAPKSEENPVESPQASVTQQPAVAELVSSPPNERDVPLIKKYNTKSGELPAMVNLIELHCDDMSGVFEYQVVFTPPVDNRAFRSKYLAQHQKVVGVAKTFDGVALFLPKRLPDEITKLPCTNMVEGEDEVEMTIIFKCQKSRDECVHFYNILFERIFRVLKYLRVGQKNFDPTAPQLIPQHKLETWPGFVKSVEIHEKDRLLLTLDVSHRVLSTQSVYQVMRDAVQSDRDRFKDNIKKALIGSIVLTRYNNKTYRIDDILFDHTPRSTFKQGDNDVSYMEYYKKQHKIDIQDDKQFLLISRMEVRISGEKEKREYIVNLVPELCYMTGLTDRQKTNFTVMKDLAMYTKLSPMKRLDSFKKFLNNVNNTPEAKAVLSEWGLKLDMEPLKLTARLLNEETIYFGKKKEVSAGPQADFTRGATSNQVLEPIDLVSWILVYVKIDNKAAVAFEETLKKVCSTTGMMVSQPKRIELQNDRTETYVTSIRKELTDPKIQIVVCIFPSLRDDRYAAVKKVMCAEIPVPSQCINSKTLKNEAKNRSIVLKILLQMNCKMGGTLWGVKIPLKNTMICGIDTYHETAHKGITVGGLVASINKEFTRWWSRPTIQEKREELVNGLTGTMEAALRAYKKYNETLPDRIILYRDGVSDGQLRFVEQYEIPQFKAAFKRIDEHYKPQLTFVVVQKRINMKLFMELRNELKNPPPGSVLDHTVTSRNWYDFYLVSQHVREGTTTPSHYIVLEDGSDFEPEILQRITYKLCYLYYNWPGTVRVPAPCQYAHKLADLVGASVRQQVGEKLNDKLFYL